MLTIVNKEWKISSNENKDQVLESDYEPPLFPLPISDIIAILALILESNNSPA